MVKGIIYISKRLHVRTGPLWKIRVDDKLIEVARIGKVHAEVR
jgi:hypothetical protein